MGEEFLHVRNELFFGVHVEMNNFRSVVSLIVYFMFDNDLIFCGSIDLMHFHIQSKWQIDSSNMLRMSWRVGTGTGTLQIQC